MAGGARPRGVPIAPGRCGISPDELTLVWRGSYQYANYEASVRGWYGLAGGGINYSPKGCAKVQQEALLNPVLTSDRGGTAAAATARGAGGGDGHHHGCPLAHWHATPLARLLEVCGWPTCRAPPRGLGERDPRRCSLEPKLTPVGPLATTENATAPVRPRSST